MVRLSTEQSGEVQDAAGKISTIYNLNVGKYDVAVSTGPSFNTKRQDAFASMAQMTQANPNLWGVIGDLLVKNMDWPGADEMAKRMRATIPPEILQDDQDQDGDQSQLTPEHMEQMQQMQQAFEQLQEQAQQLAQENEQLNGVVQGKAIEQQMAAQDNELKRYDIDVKREAASAKSEEAQAKLMLEAQQWQAEQSMQAMQQIEEPQNNDVMQQILATLTQLTIQQGEMLAAVIHEISEPNEAVEPVIMSVQVDDDGSIIG